MKSFTLSAITLAITIIGYTNAGACETDALAPSRNALLTSRESLPAPRGLRTASLIAGGSQRQYSHLLETICARESTIYVMTLIFTQLSNAKPCSRPVPPLSTTRPTHVPLKLRRNLAKVHLKMKLSNISLHAL